jgi:hypothetical protein
MHNEEAIVGLILGIWFYILLTGGPGLISLAFGKRKVTLGAIMIWVAVIGVFLVPLTGGANEWVQLGAVYGCFLLPILAAGIHLRHPRDKYLMAAWITLPLVVAGASLVGLL